MERLPSTVLNEEIVKRFDLETLCSAACVCRTLRSAVYSAVLPSLSSLHLPTFSPDRHTLNCILGRCSGLEALTLNCLRLDDSSIGTLLSNPCFQNVRELNLLCCSLLSSQLLSSIGRCCPSLRVLILELAEQDPPHVFKSNLAQMLNGCLHLESLSVKVRGAEVDASAFHSIEDSLSKSIKSLKLQPILEQDAMHVVNRVGGNFVTLSSCFKLQSLTFVLDILSDGLLITITNSLPFLVELDLEDRPNKEPLPNHDLTDTGLQALSSCAYLTSLSLTRSRQKHQASFKRVNDMGMFLLAEGCRGLESVRLCGFSKVSDAGFASILHSCQKLNKFETRNALLLSDLAFHDLDGAPCALVEVKLLSCSLITSETVKKLASSRSLEVLDLSGCKSVADSCLGSISSLGKLNVLNLSGADVTDYGLSLLGQGSLPITRLSLRGCKRVTDKGVTLLLHGGGTIAQTLSSLDLGYMPGISDRAIWTVVMVGLGITELCIRYCFYVTDSSVEALARKKTFQDGSKQLRRLDLCNCVGLSVDSLRWLKRPSFPGLHWIGIGQTRLAGQGDTCLTEIYRDRAWLTVCLDGCEMGCHDGWHFHRYQYHSP